VEELGEDGPRLLPHGRIKLEVDELHPLL
jgi:hypothetical protein